ncbi:MAG: HpaII family restriction endonuclease [Sphingopyxis sp.]|nr:HpaII family restriction endonuclease [Sphingopyxis sp.]
MDDTNRLATIKERINNIGSLNGSFTFHKCENSIFYNNLIVIDSYLPSILSKAIFLSCVSGEENIKNLVENLTKENSLGYQLCVQPAVL